MNRNRLWVTPILSVALFGCAQTQEPVESEPDSAGRLSIQTERINLRVKPNGPQGPELVVDELPTPGCKGSMNSERKKGCIVAKQESLVVADFDLKQKAQYHISIFEVCPGNEKRMDTSVNCDLPAPKQGQFILWFGNNSASPDEHGIVNFKKLAPGSDTGEFALINLNTLKADYFYRIQVCPDPDNSMTQRTLDESGCLWVDPPIQNSGLGSFP